MMHANYKINDFLMLVGDESGIPTTTNAYDLIDIDAVNYTSVLKGPTKVRLIFVAVSYLVNCMSGTSKI